MSTLTREKNDEQVQGSIQYIDTKKAYDLWSEVYDTDSNFLQALDSIEMESLVPRAAELAMRQPQTRSSLAVDLGCGTGRNTIQLLKLEKPFDKVIGLELSEKMLALAKSRCAEVTSTSTVELKAHDMMTNPLPSSVVANADLVISTLVLEHVPADVFFRAASTMLRHGGVLLMSNMHSDMGKISQAGFVDLKTGNKIRPVSYPHTIGDTVRIAEQHGLKLIENVEEIVVDTDLAKLLGPRGQKWIGVKVWFRAIWIKM